MVLESTVKVFSLLLASHPSRCSYTALVKENVPQKQQDACKLVVKIFSTRIHEYIYELHMQAYTFLTSILILRTLFPNSLRARPDLTSAFYPPIYIFLPI